MRKFFPFQRLFLILVIVFLLLSACQRANENIEASIEPSTALTAETVLETVPDPDPEPTPKPAPEPELLELSLRVASYNIKHGKLADLDMTKLADNITALELDIVGLQEIDQMTTRVNGLNTMKTLSEATEYPYYCFFKAMDYKGGEYGLGVLSKYPIVATQTFLLQTPSNIEQRILGRAEIDVNGFFFQFFVTHLSYNSRDIRDPQFKGIAEVVKSYDNYILVGDFNTTNFDEYAVIENAAMINNAQQSVGTMSTSSKSIDNIVYSVPFWSLEAPQVLKESHSDHYLLYSVATCIIEKRPLT